MDPPTTVTAAQITPAAEAEPRPVSHATMVKINLAEQRRYQAAALAAAFHQQVNLRAMHVAGDEDRKFLFVTTSEQRAFEAACDHLRMLFSEP